MWRTMSGPRSRASSVSGSESARALAGVAVFVLWLSFLALFGSGDLYCFDETTGRSGIDALDHCASHHPLGLNVAIAEAWPLASFAVVPVLVAVLWWPFRPSRAPGWATRPGFRGASCSRTRRAAPRTAAGSRAR